MLADCSVLRSIARCAAALCVAGTAVYKGKDGIKSQPRRVPTGAAGFTSLFPPPTSSMRSIPELIHNISMCRTLGG